MSFSEGNRTNFKYRKTKWKEKSDTQNMDEMGLGGMRLCQEYHRYKVNRSDTYI
jgi:hypothetical protein